MILFKNLFMHLCSIRQESEHQRQMLIPVFWECIYGFVQTAGQIRLVSQIRSLGQTVVKALVLATLVTRLANTDASPQRPSRQFILPTVHGQLFSLPSIAPINYTNSALLVAARDARDTLKSDLSGQSVRTTDATQTNSKCGLDLILQKSHITWFFTVQTF